MKAVTKLSLLLFIAALVIGCSQSEDDTVDPGDGNVQELNGISEDELDNYGGDLGIWINTREIIKKGYQPREARIVTSATEDDYDQTVTIDPFTHKASLSFSVDELTEEQESELRNGIDLEIDILDANENVVISKSFDAITFEENGNQLNMDSPELEYLQQELYFKDNMRHYLQPVDVNGVYNSFIVWKPSSAGDNGVELQGRSSSFNPGTTSEQYFFYKFPNAENEFAIYSANTGRYLTIGSSSSVLRQSGAYSYPEFLNDNSLGELYRFYIKKEENGLYTISDYRGFPLRQFSSAGDTKWRTIGAGTVQYFRIIALDIEWDVTQLDTEYLPAILPAVETSFGFNSTLRNCGSGSLEQEVGIERTVTTTYTSSISESIGLSGRVTTSVDVSVSATAEASFFGNGGSVTGEVSAGLEVSVEASQTSTQTVEESVSESNTFFSNRIITVPSGNASLVYDAYQTYSDVRVPFVKRLRLRGTHTETGQSLSGQEIATQLLITNFRGVITDISTQFVEITLEGNMFLDNIVDTQTEVRDVAANCDG